MLPTSDLKKYGFARRLKNLEQIRKDYAQDLFLFVFCQEHPGAVFKRGTCLWKLFKLPRFSEDLDFSYSKRVELRGVREKLSLLGFNVQTLKEKSTKNTLFSRMSLEADGFGSVELLVEIALRKEKGKSTTFMSPYPDIPDFEISTMPLTRIAQDKVSAILDRDKPRDLFDLYFLISRHGVNPVVENMKEFEKAIERKRRMWRSLGPLVVAKLPDFDDVKRTVLQDARG